MQSNRKKINIPAMTEADLFVNYVEIDRESPENQNETHIHRECEIYVNLSGDVNFEVENKIYRIERGSVIVTRPFEYHHCIYRSDALHKHYWILIDTPNSGELVDMIFSGDGTERNLIRLDEDELTRFSECVDKFFSEKPSKLGTGIAFLRLIDILSEHKETKASDSLSKDKLPRDVTLALNYMDVHLCEQITSEALAKHSFVSINTLERHFKEHLALTPFAMLRKKRLINSARLLRLGASVSEACERSGFFDYSNYIAAFRGFFGITPLKYKKNFTEP